MPKAKHHHAQNKVAMRAPKITGVTAAHESFQVRDVLAEMIAKYDELLAVVKKANSQSIGFDVSPVCLVFSADIHLGHPGVDYRRVFDEAQMVMDAPNTWLVTVGDIAENMILPKLMHARFKLEITPRKEWALVEHYLKLVAPKLLWSVSGNHENWVTTLTGIPYFQDVLARVKPQALYDSADATVDLRVRNAHFPIRARHRWRYYAKLNKSHGIEDAARHEGGFIVGVGAHDHTSGLVRGFTVQEGQSALAVKCGTYKMIDDHAHSSGFYAPNNSTSPAVIFWDDGKMIGFEHLDKAAEIMRMYHRKGVK